MSSGSKEHRFHPVTGEQEMALYRVTNLATGEDYWGISIHPLKRWVDHKDRCRSRPSACPKFYNSLRKYGAENFQHTVVAWFPNASLAGAMEVSIIAAGLASLNTNPGGSLGSLGRKMSPESTLLKKLATTGKKRRPETGRRISASKTGIKFTAEHRAKISEARRGKVGNRKGTTHSPEAIAKMRMAKLGRKDSPETISRKRQAQRDRRSAEAKSKENP